MKDLSFSLSLLTSSLLHGSLLLLASTLMPTTGGVTKPDFIPVDLVDVEQPKVERKTTALKVEKTKQAKLTVKHEAGEAEQLPPTSTSVTAKEEPAKQAEANATSHAHYQETPAFPANAKTEGGGSEAGGGNIFSKNDVAIVPGSGNLRGSGGTAPSGLGRDASAPGLTAPTTVLKTNREAKPIQTARASYPPMALRLGLEGDVTLRIQIDPDGRVTKAEIIKSAGGGFDEEALRAVKQSRFEPAQKDGVSVPAEFTYIYHFRLAK